MKNLDNKSLISDDKMPYEELAPTLKHHPKEWAKIIQAIGKEELQQNIRYGFILSDILGLLAEKDRYSLVQHLAKVLGAQWLKNILESRTTIFLKLFPEEDRYPLIQFMSDQWLKNILLNDNALANVLELLPVENQSNLIKKLITIIDQDKVVVAISNFASIADTLKKSASESKNPSDSKRWDFNQHHFNVYKANVIMTLEQKYSFKLGFWRGHCGRMNALKQVIETASTVHQVYDILTKERQAYEEAAKHQEKYSSPLSDPFSKFKTVQTDLRKSRYYQAVKEAQNILEKIHKMFLNPPSPPIPISV